MSSPFGLRQGAWMLAVRVAPGARGNALRGIDRAADGSGRLKVSVTAPPEDGKANAAVIKLLARSWKIPKGAIELVRGDKSRVKCFRISCDAQARQRIQRHIDKLGSSGDV